MTDATDTGTVHTPPLRPESRGGVGLQLRFTVLVLSLMLAMAALIGVVVVEVVSHTVNQQARESLGYSREELLVSWLHEIEHDFA